MNDWIVAINLGGTPIRVARADPDAIFSQLERYETNPDYGADAVLSRISSATRETAAGEPIRAMGICVPGSLDARAATDFGRGGVGGEWSFVNGNGR